jgi:hypothetical protein
VTDLKKKKKHKRWGDKFVDKRDWKKYNAQLVKRGEFLLDLGWVKNWDKELEEMNRGKVGQPYDYPNSLIEVQGMFHAKSLDYRMIEGITQQLVVIAQLPAANDYSTINRRVNKIDTKIKNKPRKIRALFNDGSGFQAINGGEYLREKYGKKNRRWIQVTLLGDPDEKEPVSFEVNIIQSSEADSARKQLDDLLASGAKITAMGGDGAMDEMKLWKFLQEKKIKPIIKPDKNARTDTDCELRNKVVKERNKFGYKKWARKNKYGFRWPATEGIFSAVKRMFGEQIRATSDQGMIQEAAIKIWAYQKIKHSTQN